MLAIAIIDAVRRSILGPAMGGALAQPSLSYPAIFARGTLFDRHPFLLPNLVCAVILATGVLVGILFLEETHESKKHRRDLGIEAGRWLMDHVNVRPKSKVGTMFAKGNFEDDVTLAEDDAPPGYRTTEGSPCLPSSRLQSPNVLPQDLRAGTKCSTARPRGTHKAFTKQVILNIIGFGLLA